MSFNGYHKPNTEFYILVLSFGFVISNCWMWWPASRKGIHLCFTRTWQSCLLPFFLEKLVVSIDVVESIGSGQLENVISVFHSISCFLLDFVLSMLFELFLYFLFFKFFPNFFCRRYCFRLWGLYFNMLLFFHLSCFCLGLYLTPLSSSLILFSWSLFFLLVFWI